MKPSLKVLDSNKDGSISKSEASSAPDLSKDFAKFDKNRDGKLDSAEFASYGGGSMGPRSSAN